VSTKALRDFFKKFYTFNINICDRECSD
jgi:hypothetical protein